MCINIQHLFEGSPAVIIQNKKSNKYKLNEKQIQELLYIYFVFLSWTICNFFAKYLHSAIFNMGIHVHQLVVILFRSF